MMYKIFYLLPLFLILMFGCGRRGSEAAKKLEISNAALDKEIDRDKENAIQGYRDAYRKTAENYVDFQLRMNQNAINEKYSGDDEASKAFKELYLERAKMKADGQKAQLMANITKYEEMINKARDKQKFKEALDQFQLTLYEGGFSADEAAAITSSIGNLILKITGRDSPAPTP